LAALSGPGKITERSLRRSVTADGSDHTHRDLEMLMASTDQWYWCFEHQRAENEGEQCRASGRLGPYGSKHEAENWKAIKDAREQTWKQEDEEWEGRGAAPE
jgi:hypothetical protein